MQTLIYLIIISALGLSLFALIDYYLLSRNVDIMLRRRLLLWAMFSSIVLPIVGGLSPQIIPSMAPQINESLTRSIELPMLFVEGYGAQKASSQDFSLGQIVQYITGLVWLVGVVSTLIRTLLSVYSLQRLLRVALYEGTYEGIGVYRLPESSDSGAFSVFGRIYLPHSLSSDQERRYILCHEAAHIRDGHNTQRLYALAFRAIHWYLPIAQYLYQALDDTHEYIADRLTLKCDESNAREYQYQLLSHAIVRYRYDMTHAFNTDKQQLKKRIIMMNKVNISTRPLKWVWLLCLPIACLMLWASNSLQASEPQTQEVARKKVNKSKAKSTQAKNNKTPIEAKVTQQNEDFVYMVVNEQPQFPGGGTALMQYLASNIKYPEEAQKKGEQGRVIVQFVVNKEGNIENAQVYRRVSTLLDAEALRVVRTMPKWSPGRYNGKIVKTKCTLPIVFRLK